MTAGDGYYLIRATPWLTSFINCQGPSVEENECLSYRSILAAEEQLCSTSKGEFGEVYKGVEMKAFGCVCGLSRAGLCLGRVVCWEMGAGVHTGSTGGRKTWHFAL